MLIIGVGLVLAPEIFATAGLIAAFGTVANVGAGIRAAFGAGTIGAYWQRLGQQAERFFDEVLELFPDIKATPSDLGFETLTIRGSSLRWSNGRNASISRQGPKVFTSRTSWARSRSYSAR